MQNADGSYFDSVYTVKVGVLVFVKKVIEILCNLYDLLLLHATT